MLGVLLKFFKPNTYPDVSDMLEAGESLQEGLIPFDTTSIPEVDDTSDLKQDNLDKLIDTLQQIDTTQSDGIVWGRVASAVDQFTSTKDRQHNDQGTLVEWSHS